ncbi:hypothetical protein AAZX31_12G002500 [Glycine max]|uniref:Exopolyphosphatase PRUNE1 isoform A n=1 Tax=Glycine soja TaxID=3848 RepID=A0A445HIP4_GLYSO|nr:exopolyphosphatase PRUNE1-like isoform X1 [Glycine soja]RZB73543.1 Exopolyphosphatase PRUNE1 isoform A [Glycine soja]
MRSAGANTPTQKEPYIRTRENPYFDGLLRSDGQIPLKSQLEFTYIGETRPKSFVSDISEEVMELSPENSAVSGLNSKSSEHSSSEKWLKTSKIAPFIQLDILSELIEPDNPKHHHLGYGQSPRTPEQSPAIHNTEKTYTVIRRKEKLSSILLPLSAASYYIGVSPEMEIVESCESIDKLNAFLKARKDDVNAGVPGKFLHAVMGSDGADVGTVASTIMYSFYLHVTSESNQFCTVPIININRANLGSHVELKWLLDSCHIDQSSLIFADEIDLSYYDIFGSLKIVLLKGSRIASKQEKLKQAVVEIFHCRKGETIYPWVKTVTTTEEESSCCTAIADKFATYSPEILASKSFSKLLLAGILLDTANLRDPRCSSKDKYMASLLINGAGRYGCNGLYQLLRYKMHDLSSLQVADILRKDFKKWTGQESADSRSVQIGMSCIGISIGQLLSHAENLAQEITRFQLSEKLRALIVVSGYYNDEKNFKREVLISTESAKLLESLLFFFDFNASRLPLKSLHFPGLKNGMKAYEIDKITSRKIVEHLIEEFVGIPKA